MKLDFSSGKEWAEGVIEKEQSCWESQNRVGYRPLT
jgi:hypothetical protein